MKKKQTTSTAALADAAAGFIAANTKAPRADGKPHKKAAVKKGKRMAKGVADRKGKKPAVKAAPKRAAETFAGVLKLPAIGQKLTRKYRGKEHVVEVTKDGFRYEGEAYASLTAIAKVVTGYRAISGPAFFGLWSRKPAAEGK